MSPSWLVFPTPVDTEPTLAVAVHHPSPDHNGVVYRDADEACWMIHLAFHHDLRNEKVPSKYSWVVPALKKERAEQVAAMCERVWKRHNEAGLPYGFKYDKTAFDNEGAIVLGEDEHGLTCSTFVLAVFRSVGVALVRMKDWPSRPDDTARFSALINTLKTQGVDEDHVRALESETSCIRFRPTEVAGACSVAALPSSFAKADKAAQRIRAAFAGRGVQPKSAEAKTQSITRKA